jgi:mono/diheme cytochrome c family protein
MIITEMKQLTSSVGAIIVSTIMSLIPFLPALATEERAQPGKTLFQQYCQDCHGPQKDGRGVLRPFLEQDPANLTSQMTQAKTDQQLFSIIKNGGGEMHGWADTFTDQQVLELVQYIRALSP